MGKLPSNLSVEELEALALSEVSRSTTKEQDPFLLFLSTFDLRPGPHVVRGTVLYKLFVTWLGTNYLPGKDVFIAQLGEVFPSHRPSGHLMSRSAADILGVLGEEREKRSRVPTWDLRSFEAFQKARKVSKGDLWVEAEALYHAYDVWARGNGRKNPMSLYRFIRVARLVLEVRVTSDGKSWFRVAEPVREFLTEKVMSELRAGWKRRDDQKKA